nr:helix-turn-helix domain-containing protein [Nocardioides panaciterrulae]
MPVTCCLVTARSTDDVPRAHRLAALAVEHAPARATAGGPLGEADALVLALLAAHRDADPARLAGLVLGPLADQPHLVAGLDAYLETGSASAAAATLGLHPQTMRHRLRRLVQRTGRDPRRPWDRFVLEVARTIAAADGPAPAPAR